MKIYRSEGRVHKKNIKKVSPNVPAALKTEASSPICEGIGNEKAIQLGFPQEMLILVQGCKKWLDDGFWGRVLTEHCL